MKEEMRSVLILFGGASSEHEVSCVSAASVIRNLDDRKYRLYKVGITREGAWLLTDSSPDRISNGEWRKESSNKRAALMPDAGVHGLCVFHEDGTHEDIHIDVVFPVLHGKKGEDGTLQGLLDLADIPYVGAGTTASAACMDKVITKIIVEKTGVRQADYYVTDRYSFADGPQQTLLEVEEHFRGKYPLFVKPANAGSSVGISKVKDTKSLFDAICLAAEEDHKVLIEEAVVGREVEVAVLGNRQIRAAKPGEIFAAGEFYDYEAKYINEQSRTEIVTDLSREKEEELQKAAIMVYKAMGCKGLARVDFFMKQDGEIVFNEINTMPGFTHISMYPKMWEATNLSYEKLLDTLIELAMDEIE